MKLSACAPALRSRYRGSNAQSSLSLEKFRRPTMQPVLVKNYRDFELSLEFWCSEGHLAQFDLILTLFRPTPTYFKPFCRADLTYFDLFCRAGLTYFHLFRPISFHNKAPWAGHLKKSLESMGFSVSPLGACAEMMTETSGFGTNCAGKHRFSQ